MCACVCAVLVFLLSLFHTLPSSSSNLYIIHETMHLATSKNIFIHSFSFVLSQWQMMIVRHGANHLVL